MNNSCHCGNYRPAGLTRRDVLKNAACGFGSIALSALMSDPNYAHISATVPDIADMEEPSAIPHFAPRVKRIVYLYMDGGPSQVDTFDPKPRLNQENGQPFKMKVEKTQFDNVGNTLASPWKFKNYGESGIPVSDLFPHVAQHVDSLAVVRSMVSDFSEHTNANYFLHTGNGFQGRPSMGAWVCYGLGSECENLPGFVVLNGGLIPPGGLDCFNSGFLPATYQGSILAGNEYPLANIRRTESTDELQHNKLKLVERLDKLGIASSRPVDPIESAIANYELAYKMQSAVPDLAGLVGETEATRELYGLNSKNDATAIFGRQCLVARRLLERGVRFIELTCPSVNADRWDQHNELKQGHEANAKAVDQGIGALLTDLKQCGLFDDTLVVWSGEFGRTPFAQGSDGRDHNPYGFSLWMAGGGIKGGTIHGATDEYGYKAIENRVEIHDLHATMLHLLGVDHKQLTYRWSGRDMRLTDVHGNVVNEILS